MYAGGLETYVAEDSTITVQDRRVVIAATTVATIASGAMIARPTPPPLTPRPTPTPTPRPSSPQAVSPSGPEAPRRKANDDKT